MKATLNGGHGNVCSLGEVSPKDLVAGELYYGVTKLMDDLGGDRYIHDMVYATASSAISAQTGKPLILLRFLGDKTDKSLSQIPMTTFFGPIKMEITP